MNIVRVQEVVPAVLDCGCSATPARTDGVPITTGGTLVVCTDHGLRHSVAVAEVRVVVTYTSRRLDPADPESAAEVEDVA